MPNTDFVFMGGNLAIDLVNTEVVVRGKRRDLLATPAALDRWWEAARAYHAGALELVGDTSPEIDDPLLEATKALRATLRHILSDIAVERPVHQASLARLNQVLTQCHPALEQTPDGSLTMVYRTGAPSRHTLLNSVAISAMQLLTTGTLSRIHQCRNERCILFFYDETRSATRHWCSVACMNRARSIERYRQAKAGV